jgi:FixJ family two-component response regulator
VERAPRGGPVAAKSQDSFPAPAMSKLKARRMVHARLHARCSAVAWCKINENSESHNAIGYRGSPLPGKSRIFIFVAKSIPSTRGTVVTGLKANLPGMSLAKALVELESYHSMSERILIVDDESSVRLSFRMALETDGYEIFEAQSIEPAFQMLTEYSFALVILDLRMPGTDGLELLTKMSEADIHTPVMIVTAYGDIPRAVEAMKLGATDFLQKPLLPADLRHAVAEAVKRHPSEDRAAADVFTVHIAAAKRCLNLQAFAKARLHLAKAMELNNKSVEAFNLAGVLAELLEDYQKAKKYYGQAIRLDSRYEPAQQNMRRLFELDHFGSSNELVNLGND